MYVRYAGEVVNNGARVAAASARTYTFWLRQRSTVFRVWMCKWEYSILYISIFEKNHLNKISFTTCIPWNLYIYSHIVVAFTFKVTEFSRHLYLYKATYKNALESVPKHILILVQQVRAYEYRQTETLLEGRLVQHEKKTLVGSLCSDSLHTCQSRAVLGSVVL